MKRILLTLFLLLMTTITSLAQEYVSGRILSGENKEPLALASIYSSSGVGTLSNMEGKFQLRVKATDTLRISYVGYETMYVLAGNMSPVISLKPNDVSLKEVVVVPIDVILEGVHKQLKKEYKKNKGADAAYFYRQITHCDSLCTEIIEAFLSAKSAVNVRDLSIITGRNGIRPAQNPSIPYTSFTNYYLTSQVGPMVLGESQWTDLITPFPEKLPQHYYHQKYQVEYQCLTDTKGESIYEIDLKLARAYASSPGIEGKLYVDAATLRPLAFRGSIRNVRTVFTINLRDGVREQTLSLTRHLNFDFNVSFMHANGYTEVEQVSTHMTCQGSFDSTEDYQSVLFNVGIPNKEGERVSETENVRNTIARAGYDSTFWSINEVVKRTEREQELVKEFEDKRFFERPLTPVVKRHVQ